MARFARDPIFLAAQAAVRMPGPLASLLRGRPDVVDSGPLDQHVQLMLRLLDRIDFVSMDSGSVAHRRTRIRRASGFGMPSVQDISVVDLELDTRPAILRARGYRATRLGTKRVPVIVYFHGGGWVVGDLDTHDQVCRLVAGASGCEVISVDYRLAPEHPFPAAVEDAVAAFRWIRDHPGDRQLPGAVAVMGDSAGGNLAAVVALTTRDDAEGGPVAQGLVYPGTDLRLGFPSVQLFAEGYFLTREELEWFRAHYAPEPEQWLDPLVSPLLADDVSRVAPTWLWTAGFDPLRDEGIAYAARLRDVGVEVHEHCYPDQVHGFLNMGILPGALERTEEVGRQMGDLVARGMARRAQLR